MEGLLTPIGQKRKQPTHLLKFRNRVNGFDTPGPAGPGEDRGMEVDAPDTAEMGKSQISRNGEKKDKKDKQDKKKRKSEIAESPKKKIKAV
jgi:hypothetical protein